MGDLIITVPAAKEKKVYEAFAEQHGWTKKILNPQAKQIDNPETAKDFTTKIIIDLLSGAVRNVEARKATDATNIAVGEELKGIKKK